ncbi:Wound-responsive family protein [Senna tora]|uniref:Wound-responsive family protein n=1 Tax=Senna tora TaxID=362788 RepID=A0A834WKV9_9FABA|nr:Wound-responsive family protein [Senna tora]
MSPKKSKSKLIVGTIWELRYQIWLCLHSTTTKGWVVATSVGVVEALKDQGFGRWNNAMRSVQKHAKNRIIKSASQARKISEPSSSAVSNSKKARDYDEEMKKSEESLRTIMFLSTWGPNS